MRFNFCPSCSAEEEKKDFGTVVDELLVDQKLKYKDKRTKKIVKGYEPNERPWMVFFQIATGMVFR